MKVCEVKKLALSHLQGSAYSPPRRAGLAPRKSAEQALPDRHVHGGDFAQALCPLLARRVGDTRGRSPRGMGPSQ
jgi:hypothetical protein